MAPHHSPYGQGLPTNPPPPQQPVSPESFLNDDNPWHTAQLPPVAKSRNGIIVPLLLGIIVLLITFLVGGFFLWRLNATSPHTPIAAPTTIIESVIVSPEEQAGLATDTSPTAAAVENSAYQHSVNNAGLDAYGFSSLSCLGSDTWVFSAISTDGHHVLICQSGSSDSYYYTHDYLSDIYRKDVDRADVAAGEFEVYNDDATITITPTGLMVAAKEGSDFSSTFSTSFTTNPW